MRRWRRGSWKRAGSGGARRLTARCGLRQRGPGRWNCTWAWPTWRLDQRRDAPDGGLSGGPGSGDYAEQWAGAGQRAGAPPRPGRIGRLRRAAGRRGPAGGLGGGHGAPPRAGPDPATTPSSGRARASRADWLAGTARPLGRAGSGDHAERRMGAGQRVGRQAAGEREAAGTKPTAVAGLHGGAEQDGCGARAAGGPSRHTWWKSRQRWAATRVASGAQRAQGVKPSWRASPMPRGMSSRLPSHGQARRW